MESTTPDVGDRCRSVLAPLSQPQKQISNRQGIGIIQALRELYSFSTKRDLIILVLPAIICSILCGLLPPCMTIMIGSAFQSFADYAVSTSIPLADPTAVEEAKSLLRHRIGIISLKLALIGCVTLALSLIAHTLWAISASKISQKIQVAIYDSISERDLAWFENGMRTRYIPTSEENSAQPAEGVGGGLQEKCEESPAGLMSRFSRQTEDIRAAISGKLGLIIQYTVTILANIILAFTKSFKLSMVILCTIPIVALLTAISGSMTDKPLAKQGVLESSLSSEIGRVIKDISVAKAFNAQPLEVVKLVRMSRDISKMYLSIVRVWALRIGICQWLSLLMFVQGFGYGSRLISTQAVTAGDVNTVFWSCLVASSYLQMMIPLLSYVEKAKIATYNILALMAIESSSLKQEELRDSVKKDVSLYNRSEISKKPLDAPPVLVPLSEIRKVNSRKYISTGTQSFASTCSPPNISIPNPDNIQKPPVEGENVIQINNSPPTTPTRLSSRLSRSFPLAQKPRKIRYSNKLGKARTLRKLVPTQFEGQLELKDVTFYYPSNDPHLSRFPFRSSSLSTQIDPVPNLDSASIFFPPGEFTFIVGESGSGKSTISSLILGLYPLSSGTIDADNFGSIEWLDKTWYRNQIGLVSGLTSNLIFPGTIHQNIAIGVGGSRDWRAVSREEVTRAAKFALLHNFISDLPDGYDTRLVDGSLSSDDLNEKSKGGSVQGLSGGEKQRLGLARAWIRNPTVLVLDEATSALDLTKQSLMYNSIRHWRSNKTTICITHDLKPIRQTDYVYVISQGKVVEHDFRCNLEAMPSNKGFFRQLSKRAETANNFESRFKNNKVDQSSAHIALNRQAETIEMIDTNHSSQMSHEAYKPNHFEIDKRRSEKRVTVLAGFIHAMQSENGFLSLPTNGITQGFSRTHNSWRSSSIIPRNFDSEVSRSGELKEDIVNPHLQNKKIYNKTSLELRRPISFLQKNQNKSNQRNFPGYAADDDNDYQEYLAAVMLQSSKFASDRRPKRISDEVTNDPKNEPESSAQLRKKWTEDDLREKTDAKKDSKSPHHAIEISDNSDVSSLKITKLWKNISPTICKKWVLLLGLLSSLASGAMTPVFSVLLGNLLSKIADPPEGFILRTSAYIIIVSLVDGALMGSRIYLMEWVSTMWLENMRKISLEKIVLQDQAWFDQTENSHSNIINRLMKDGNDCKDLIGQILAETVTIITLVLVAFVWAVIMGWQLTLIGLSLAPIFFIIIGGSGKIGARLEQLNKMSREEVANQFHFTISSVKALRSMAIEPLMRESFVNTTQKSRKLFIRASPFGGMSYGLNVALTYFAEGLMFYAGATLVIKGTYTFSRLSQVFSLIIFSVTFAGQMISSVPSYSKASRAAIDLMRLVNLPKTTKETSGDLIVPIKGRIEFRKVNFSYPARPDVQVLKSVSFVIEPGECVGIVGSSGSGKSTISLLLHRFYEVETGSIRLDGFNISRIDSRQVRDDIGLVTQQPVLFNATILENLSYGYVPVHKSEGVSSKIDQLLLRVEVEKILKKVNLDGFVKSLPQGLDTNIGENSDLISSGQAQRLSLGRMLLQKKRKILVFDETTSALDLINQGEIMKTINEVRQGKTSLIITHKAAVMKMCDRLIVMDKGRVVEQGTYDSLMNNHNGFLSSMSRAGEWKA
ncbi:P-loop containing nucleoside triphosphate hydrolase protein [Phakopsora pachyrhizi]|uniref:P-loop containing nucleoside triphosphate hydrolase protein n=1 Tax=Phakopsora pachyrhizi TaxID=170000 RepID=A0AAV0BA39_PHAPC|nr:P-loop containing nucleoside triphosphate hydrolase protein [Phakopsora pachyrhizi]